MRKAPGEVQQTHRFVSVQAYGRGASRNGEPVDVLAAKGYRLRVRFADGHVRSVHCTEIVSLLGIGGSNA